MDIFISLIGFGLGVFAMYFACIAYENERLAKTRLQIEKAHLKNQNLTGQTIIADCILCLEREEVNYIDKHVVIARLNDAMMGLGLYPTKRFGEKADSND